MPERLMVLAAGPEQVPLIMAAKQRKVYTIVVDPDPSRPGMQLADKALVSNILDEATCIELAYAEQVNGVVATALSLGMRTVAAVAEALRLPGLRRQSAYLTTDKLAMRKRLAETGLDSTPFQVAIDVKSAFQAVENLGVPLIFKPPDGSGSRGVRKVCSYDEVHDAYAAAAHEVRSSHRAGQVLIERYVEGRDFGSEGFVVGDQLHVLTIRDMRLTSPPYCQEIGYSFPAALSPSETDRIQGFLEAAVRAFGLRDSAFHADFKLNSVGEPILIEMGPRLPGYGLTVDFIPHATGVKPFDILIDLALGHRLSLPSLEQNPTVMMFLQLKPGRLKTNVRLISEALSRQPGVLRLECNLEPGDIIPPVTDGASAMKHGYVITAGDTVAEAECRAHGIITRLHAEVEQ